MVLSTKCKINSKCNDVLAIRRWDSMWLASWTTGLSCTERWLFVNSVERKCITSLAQVAQSSGDIRNETGSTVPILFQKIRTGMQNDHLPRLAMPVTLLSSFKNSTATVSGAGAKVKIL